MEVLPLQAAFVECLAFAGYPFVGNLVDLEGSHAPAALCSLHVHFEFPFGPFAAGLAFVLEPAISAAVLFASDDAFSPAVAGKSSGMDPLHWDAVVRVYDDGQLGHHTALFLEHGGHRGGPVDGGGAYLLQVEEQ